MIAKLKGIVDSQGEDWAVIDVGGVGYLVFASGRTLGRLPAAGGAVSLLIETHMREDHIHLYGFADAAERDWFRLLLTVQGVGAKVALALQSALSSDEMTLAINAGDKAMLSRAQGVGPRLAARLVTELKGKALPAALAMAPRAGAAAVALGPSEGEALRDAASALANLGYRPAEAHAALLKVREGPGGAEAGAAALIRLALKELGKEGPR